MLFFHFISPLNPFGGLHAKSQRSRPLLPVVLFSQARAEFYRWVDKDGKEFISNDRNQVPPEYRASATVVTPGTNRVSVSNKGAAPAGAGKTLSPAGEHKDKYGRGEEYWRRKAGNLRLKLRNQQDEYDGVLKQIASQSEHAKPGKGKKKAAGLDKKKLKLEKEIAQTTRLLEVDLPEEARKADAYPGWLRE